MAILGEWMGKRCWPWDHQWSRTWQKESPADLHSLTKNTSFERKDRDFLQQDTRAAALGRQSYGRSYFLFAERNFRLCVNRNFDTISDPVLPEPNRIFGLLNLSIYYRFTITDLPITLRTKWERKKKQSHLLHNQKRKWKLDRENTEPSEGSVYLMCSTMRWTTTSEQHCSLQVVRSFLEKHGRKKALLKRM